MDKKPLICKSDDELVDELIAGNVFPMRQVFDSRRATQVFNSWLEQNGLAHRLVTANSFACTMKRNKTIHHWKEAHGRVKFFIEGIGSEV